MPSVSPARIRRVVAEMETASPSGSRDRKRSTTLPFPTPEGPARTISVPRRTRPRYFLPNFVSNCSRCLLPNPRTRRVAEMSSSSMIFWARTLPTPGSDSSTVDTFILPSVSSLSAFLSTSASVRLPDLSSPLTSARFLRAAAAFFSASARCSGVSVGSAMNDLLRCRGTVRERRGVYARGLRRDKRSGCRDLHVSSHVAPDRARCADAIVRRRDRATDDEVVRSALDRLARREHAHLIMSVGAGRTDPGHDETELLAADVAHVAHVVAGYDDAVEAGLLRFPRERRRRREFVGADRRQHRHGDHHRRWHAGLVGAALCALHRCAHHRVAAERVHVQHRDPETRDVRARALDGVRDVVQLCIDEHRAVRGDAAHGLGPVGPAELKTDLEQSDLPREFASERLRCVEVGHVEREGDRRLGGRDHARCSSGAGARSPTVTAPRSAAGESIARRCSSETIPFAMVTGSVGSTSVATPTCTADAPASIASTASSPDRIPPLATSGIFGSARWTSAIARSMSGLSAGPDNQPTAAPSAGRVPTRSIASAGGEAHNVSPDAPARAAAIASGTTSVPPGSFANTGTSDIRATAPTTSVTRSACAPSTGRSSSRSGPDRCTSMAATPSRPCSTPVMRT